MAKLSVLYLHGLGCEELRSNERRLLEFNRRRGIGFEAAHIDWRSKETFEQLLGRIASRANDLLNDVAESGGLVIEGSSAGGSLAINVAASLNDRRVRTISHSGRLTVGNFRERDWRSLERCAHLGTPQESRSFYDSVTYCEEITATLLTQEDKARILITRPWADEVVPVSTMTLEGIRTVTMPVVGHSLGIGMAILRMPSILEGVSEN